MGRERLQVLCDCGCGRRAYHNQLVEIRIEGAIDESLRQTVTRSRFWVTRECKEPFEEELAMMQLLQQLVMAYPPPAQTRWWLVNAWLNPFYPWPRILRAWWMRVGGAIKVMRFQHAIHERRHGFAYARRKGIQSAILFGCPRFLQGAIAKRFLARAKKEAAQNATLPQPDPELSEAGA